MFIFHLVILELIKKKKTNTENISPRTWSAEVLPTRWHKLAWEKAQQPASNTATEREKQRHVVVVIGNGDGGSECLRARKSGNGQT